LAAIVLLLNYPLPFARGTKSFATPDDMFGDMKRPR
jgi:hypothetical protein